MLIPKRVKYRRQHRGRMKGKAQVGNEIVFGEYGLQALEPAWITNQQIEAARVAMTRYIKRVVKSDCTFPDKPVTSKPAGHAWVAVGFTEYWVAVKPGRILFELAGLQRMLLEAMRLAAQAAD